MEVTPTLSSTSEFYQQVINSEFVFDSRSSLELSSRLSALISPGDRVAMLTPNTAQYVISQWAVWMAGGVAVPLCREHPPSSHQYYLKVSLC